MSLHLNKHWKPLAEAVAHEKNLPVERIVAALAAALASLTLRKHGLVGQCKVEGLLESEPQAWFQAEDSNAWEPVELPALTRTAAQWVKQALYQNLRQELREQTYAAWQHRQGDLVRGVVKRADFQRIQVDLGQGVEGVLLREDRLAGDFPKPGQSLQAVVDRVSKDGSGPVIRLSRVSERFIQALFEREVPEVDEGHVRLVAVARKAGQLTKVAVQSTGGYRGDPVAACVGMRGARIQAITRELGQERLDLLQWHENVSENLAAALGSGVVRMVLDEAKERALVGVQEADLAKIIGRGGINVRLAAQLTGWSVEAVDNRLLDSKVEEEENLAADELAQLLVLDIDLAKALVQEGLGDVVSIAQANVSDLEALFPELAGGAAQELWQRSHEAAVQEATLLRLEAEERLAGHRSLLELGLTELQATALEHQGIASANELADQSVMDVLPWKGMDRQLLGQWIMAARHAHWEHA